MNVDNAIIYPEQQASNKQVLAYVDFIKFSQVQTIVNFESVLCWQEWAENKRN
jgi:hypothetical protein